MNWFKNLLIVLLSTVFSVLLFLTAFNNYLKISGKAKESLFLKWTLINSRYSTKYIFWDYPHCTKNPGECDFPEEQYVSFPVEVFKPPTYIKCDKYTKILFLGDSFTVAPWTQKGESFPSVFSKRFADSENKCVYQYRLASGGSGNDQQLAAFLNLKDKLNPDIVIWQFYYNDFYDNVKQALYDPNNQQLSKRFTWSNTVFLAGFLNQIVPLLSSTTLGMHIMHIGETRDVFSNWPVSAYDQEKVIEYNTDKIALMLKKIQTVAGDNSFSLYTTLAPLECQVVPDIPCRGINGELQDMLRKILIENSAYTSMDSLSIQTQNILGFSTEDTTSLRQNYPFNTDKDVNPPGARHFSSTGNKQFGAILFENFKQISNY